MESARGASEWNQSSAASGPYTKTGGLPDATMGRFPDAVERETEAERREDPDQRVRGCAWTREEDALRRVLRKQCRSDRVAPRPMSHVACGKLSPVAVELSPRSRSQPRRTLFYALL
ncbi:hypothetical protein MRX96_059602 [Rhipicephalus microplus]